jgi:hypothetical protein
VLGHRGEGDQNQRLREEEREGMELRGRERMRQEEKG